MREAVKRARWMALTLSMVCVGALSYPAPSAHAGPDVGPSLVLQDAGAAVVVPTSSWATAVKSGNASSPSRSRRSARTAPPSSRAGGAVHGPNTPELVPVPSGASLLGLHAAPANAPPHA